MCLSERVQGNDHFHFLTPCVIVAFWLFFTLYFIQLRNIVYILLKKVTYIMKETLCSHIRTFL